MLLPNESTRASAPKKMRERERAHRLSETIEQREERLRKRRDRDRARCAANTAETAEQREERMRKRRDLDRARQTATRRITRAVY